LSVPFSCVMRTLNQQETHTPMIPEHHDNAGSTSGTNFRLSCCPLGEIFR
jgi:hypothetical protein